MNDFPTGASVSTDALIASSIFIKKLKLELLETGLYENFDNDFLYQIIDTVRDVIERRNNAEVVQQLIQK